MRLHCASALAVIDADGVAQPLGIDPRQHRQTSRGAKAAAIGGAEKAHWRA